MIGVRVFPKFEKCPLQWHGGDGPVGAVDEKSPAGKGESGGVVTGGNVEGGSLLLHFS